VARLKAWRVIKWWWENILKGAHCDFIAFLCISSAFLFIFLLISFIMLDSWPWNSLVVWLKDCTRYEPDCYFRGYVFSVFFGGFPTFLISELLHFYVDCKYPMSAMHAYRRHGRPRFLGFLTGVVERVLITTLVGFEVSGAAGFIGGWVVTKSLGLYASSQRPSRYERMRMFVSLLNGTVSVFFGIIGGLIISKQ
jgi:hypothetical protein